MKTPAQLIRALYDADSPRTFAEDMEAHLLNGYVFSTPEIMLMARAVDSTADPNDINDPWHKFPRETADAWYIYAFAYTGTRLTAQGLVKKLLRYMPYALPLACWGRKRDSRIRFYSITKLAAL